MRTTNVRAALPRGVEAQRANLGKTDLVGWQASRRGGEVRLRLAGARVVLGGRAQTVVRGELV